MSLTNGDGNMVMPVGPMYGNGGNGMWGDGGFFWLLVLFIFAGFGNGNWGGFGGGTGSEVQRGFDQQAVMGSLNGLTTAVTSGFAGVNQGISNGFAQAEIAANARQMADMNQNFALQSAFQNCCCENRLGLANLGSDIAREACADRQATADAMTALSNKMDNMYNSLQMQNYQDKLDAKNERIADLQNQLTMASLSASQNAQTAQIMADNAAQTTALERYLNPTPIPAYPVPNPNCCTNSCNRFA